MSVEGSQLSERSERHGRKERAPLTLSLRTSWSRATHNYPSGGPALTLIVQL